MFDEFNLHPSVVNDLLLMISNVTFFNAPIKHKAPVKLNNLRTGKFFLHAFVTKVAQNGLFSLLNVYTHLLCSMLELAILLLMIVGVREGFCKGPPFLLSCFVYFCNA
jgi:hypothetical protein